MKNFNFRKLRLATFTREELFRANHEFQGTPFKNLRCKVSLGSFSRILFKSIFFCFSNLRQVCFIQKYFLVELDRNFFPRSSTIEKLFWSIFAGKLYLCSNLFCSKIFSWSFFFLSRFFSSVENTPRSNLVDFFFLFGQTSPEV